MPRYKTVNVCTGCKYYGGANGNSEKFCHYCCDTGKCRIIDGKIVPAGKCYEKKIFFEAK